MKIVAPAFSSWCRTSATRAGGVDAVGDRAYAEAGEICHEIFETRVSHDRNAIAGFDAERQKTKRKRLDLVLILPPGNFLIESEILVAKRDGVRPRFDTLEEQLRHALSVDRPGSLLVLLRNVQADSWLLSV